MSIEGIFINGVFSTVVREIIDVQTYVPEQILYLQPHAGDRIVRLWKNPPSVNSPVQLFLSLTDNLPTVSHTCEIVGWDDKRELVGRKREIIEEVVKLFQPKEEGVYSRVSDDGPECVNLLPVWRMRQLSKSFSVAELRKVDDDQPVSTNRSTSGGWVYVKYFGQEWLESHF